MIDSINTIDKLIILAYFVVVLVIGFYFSRNNNHSAEGYFLANRNKGWFVIGLSIFTTNISSEHLVGLASAGSKTGIAVGHFEWLAILFILMLGWIFSPLFLKSKVNTIPELIGRKFGQTIRKFYSGLSIFTYIFTKITISLLAGGILLNELFGWNFVTSVTVMILFTGIYTIVGGLRSVMYAQVFQAAIFLMGGIAVMVYGIESVGGSGNFIANLPSSHLEIFKPMSDPDFPWLGILIGAPILAAWYWWADQYIVQRLLSARNVSEAKKGTVFAAILKIFPFLFLILPGMVALELTDGQVGNSVYTVLFSAGIFPVGIKGLILSGFFAAIMSSLASAFNSTATLIAYDFFGSKENSDSQLILIGRLSTIFIVVVSIVFIPLIRLFDNGIYVNLQRLQAFISPPIVVIFIMALLWKWPCIKCALWTLIIGEFIGVLRIIADYAALSLNINLGILSILHNINYLYFAAYLFLFSTFLFIGLSFLFRKETVYNKMEGSKVFFVTDKHFK